MSEKTSPSGTYQLIQRAPREIFAFVPDPLPPTLTFDAELAAALADASLRLGELAGVAAQIANPHLLIQPFIKREAVMSSRIEGTEAEVEEVYAFEATQRSLPGFREPADRESAKEVTNYIRATEHGLRRLQDLPASLRLLRELHGVLLDGVRGAYKAPGEFRRVQNWIGRPGSEKVGARYIPPPVPEMETALFRLEEYINREDSSEPPLIRLALIHYQFEAIHPFLDGNGRIGRLLISLLLVHWKILPLPLLYLSAYFERHRQAYYDHLLAVSEEGAWNGWLRFFLRGIERQSADAIRLTQQLQNLQRDWRERLTRPGIPALIQGLVDRLFERPYVTIPQARDELGVTYPTAQKYVESLVTEGILELVPQSANPKWFVAREIVYLAKSGGLAANERTVFRAP